MSEERPSEERTRNPAFHVHPHNRLTGTNVIITLNPHMARALCEMIEEIELSPEEAFFYAFAKRLRRHYATMDQEQQRPVPQRRNSNEPVFS